MDRARRHAGRELGTHMARRSDGGRGPAPLTVASCSFKAMLHCSCSHLRGGDPDRPPRSGDPDRPTWNGHPEPAAMEQRPGPAAQRFKK
ncbi:hypothetical protein FQA47_025526 [Oryzias melastigma]|uniref:Uncharacterized protein n=1 Tax=Oryzias melastigma TaxID=30732 RepID=A0A834FNT2_ORYME|nr:hypothetical protein FQA47_025526 [Oryzias melastigma]